MRIAINSLSKPQSKSNVDSAASFHGNFAEQCGWRTWIIQVALILLGLLCLLALSTRVEATPRKCASLPVGEDLPKDARINALVKQGTECARERNLPGVIAAFSEVIGLDPNNMSAYLNRGTAYIQGGFIELGLSDFSYVIRKDPSILHAWYNRGSAFVAAGQYDAAIADLSEAIRLDPNFARAYCNRGLAWVKKRDYESALPDLERGIEKAVDMPICLYARGELHYLKGNYELAVQDFSKGIGVAPTLQGFESRAKTYERLGEHNKALADYKSALKIAPGHEHLVEAAKRLESSKE